MPDSKKRVLAEDLSAYERWELPAFAGGTENQKSVGLQTSKKRADKLPTAGELEKIRKAAYDEGFAEGKRDGFKSGQEDGRKSGMAEGRKEGQALGKAEGHQQIEQAVASLSKLMTDLADPISAQEKQLAQAMANISIAISRSVIHRELHLDSEVVGDLVGQILGTLPNVDGNVSLTINPGDMEYVTQAVEKSGLGVKIETDSRLHPGGCKVSSSTQLIDYTVEKRFQKTVQEMLLNATQQSSAVLAQESPSEIQEQSEYSAELLDQVSEQVKATQASDSPDLAEPSATTETDSPDQISPESRLDSETEPKPSSDQED